MTDESQNISANTWARAADSINKIGYMDGAADGQKASFQPSFDTGYKLGFSFGLQIGLKEAMLETQEERFQLELKDTRRINCQICLNSSIAQENTCNLCNSQMEKNEEFLQR